MLYKDSWKNAGHNHDESQKYTELNEYNKHCFTSENQHVKIASLPIENQDGWWKSRWMMGFVFILIET